MGKNRSGHLLALQQIQKKYGMDIERFDSIEYTLDWTKVKCSDGYYTFNPEKRISRSPIPPLRIESIDCHTSFNEIIKKYHSHLPKIKWHVNNNLEIILSNLGVFKSAVPYLKKKLEITKNLNNVTISIGKDKYNLLDYELLVKDKIEEQKSKQIPSSIFSERHILDWKNIIILDGHYIILPIINGIFIKPITTKKKHCKKEHNKLISQFKEKLPNIHFTINGDFEIEQLELSALEIGLSKIRKKEWKLNLEEQEENKKDDNVGVKGINNSLFHKTFSINWEDVYFMRNRYSFDPNHNKSLSKHNIERLYIEDSRSRESFNFIIKYLMKRMPVIHYKITENFTVKLLDTPLLEVAINFLVREQAKYDVGIGEVAEITGRTLNAEKLTFSSAMSKAASMKLDDFKKYKSQFINYLILQQHKEYKVVPMSESITHSNITFEEATFIFSTKSCDNSLLLIIENVNPDRSTIIFKVYPKQYKDALQTVFDFMQSNLVNKRSSIREKSLTFSECGIIKYWTCNHDSFNDWKERMERYIGTI